MVSAVKKKRVSNVVRDSNAACEIGPLLTWDFQ